MAFRNLTDFRVEERPYKVALANWGNKTIDLQLLLEISSKLVELANTGFCLDINDAAIKEYLVVHELFFCKEGQSQGICPAPTKLGKLLEELSRQLASLVEQDKKLRAAREEECCSCDVDKMRCPECGQKDTFDITCTSVFTIRPVTGADGHLDLIWNGDSACVCPGCAWSGKARDFMPGKPKRKK